MHQFGRRPADQLVRLVPQDPRGRRAHINGAALRVDQGDGVPTVLDQGPEALLARLQRILAREERLLRALSLRSLQGHGDKVRHGAGEVLFVERPAPRKADVFVAQDADHPAAQAQRHVQHGGNAQGREVGIGELTGSGIRGGVVRRDGALLLQGPKVGRKVSGLELAALG